jgi:hypothetical protein
MSSPLLEFLDSTSPWFWTNSSSQVAQLYPKPDGSSTDAMELGKWSTSKGKRLRVKVRGVEVIVEAPRPLR